MGNGAIIPFLLTQDDDDAALQDAARNMETIRHFYERVYIARSADAAEDLITENYHLHREGLLLNGVEALKELIRESFIRRRNLQVEIGRIVASRSHAAYTLKITYTNVLGHRFRVNGLSLSRLEGDQIASTWVTYGEPERDT
jgi:hypothetical protein